MGVWNVGYWGGVVVEYIRSGWGDIYVENEVRVIVENEENEEVGMVDVRDFDGGDEGGEVGIVMKKEFEGEG